MASRLQPATQKSQGVGKRVPSLKGLGINQRRCPSTHVLGYACAALRAGFVKILHLSLSRDVQGSPLPRDLACFRNAMDDLDPGPPSRAARAVLQSIVKLSNSSFERYFRLISPAVQRLVQNSPRKESVGTVITRRRAAPS